MATYEQCKAALQERCQTKQDVIDFIDNWQGHFLSGPLDENECVSKNIDAIVERADRNNLLDQLGLKLGLPSEAEAGRLNTVWINRRSWLAVTIAVASLIVASISLWQSSRSSPNENREAETSQE